MKYNKGFAPVLVLIIVLGVLAVGGVAYFAGKSSAPKNEVSDNSNDTPPITNNNPPVISNTNNNITPPVIAKPSITVISPNGGESYTNIIPVRWTSKNIQGNVNLQFYHVNRLMFTVPSVPNTGSKDVNLSNYYTQSASSNVAYVKICDTSGVCSNMNNQPFAFNFTIAPNTTQKNCSNAGMSLTVPNQSSYQCNTEVAQAIGNGADALNVGYNNKQVLSIYKFTNQVMFEESKDNTDYNLINSNYPISGTTGLYYEGKLSIGSDNKRIVVPSQRAIITIAPASYPSISQTTLNSIVNSISF